MFCFCCVSRFSADSKTWRVDRAVIKWEDAVSCGLSVSAHCHSHSNINISRHVATC